ncbi:NAD(P)H-binding protein [Aeromonas veronii]|uniref:NAD(P)H-binding protein n=1 Tax=Aeromonas veronii TaxID=654 RepID=UPI000F5D51C4|nr:NAD(P)H-binding protein [Aeromonas veronii]MCX0420810.1 NAD(P)H-binding protein [Aeromonas veronii]RRA91047.1 NAD-dependent epimerase/dehydratase family protein [Aeromonas veronii bv. sobria]TNI74211.1 nucleoside-diphosphate sugar epimerase [Aeromonas veronii]WIJ40634.1 NAD(P)H-binding protein [Aeromonas veronii]
MSRILIAGASGLIGRELVQQLPAEHELTLLCRTPGKEAHHWLPVNFDDLASVTLSRPVDIAFCALGTTRKEAGSAEAFRRVDLDYVIAFAELARRHGCQRLIVVSSMGASTSSPALYPRTKGEMEQALLAQSWPRLAIVRPAMLLGDRQPPRLSEQIFQTIYPLFRTLLVGKLARWRAIEAQQVARAMIALSKLPAGCEIVENEQLLAL